jgi:hypothetical protein
MHKANGYISFFRAKILLECGYLFRQDLAQTWFKITNGKENHFLNAKTARKIKDQIINKK